MKNQISELMQEQMSRKDFVRLSIFAIFSLFGVANLIQYLLSHSPSRTKRDTVSHTPKERHGFGASKFGV